MDDFDEDLYRDDVNNSNVTRHILPPRFVFGENCIRIFFLRFEVFRNCFNQNWSDAFTINLLCNLVCDTTLLVIFNFPPEVQASYERTKRYLITYFSTGENSEMLWHDLSCRRQKNSQTVVKFFNELLEFNKILQVPRQILKLIFVAGLRPEIRNYLGLHRCENRTLQEVFYLAKKIEIVDNSEIFREPKDFKAKLNRGKENYTKNNLGQRNYNESPQVRKECYDNNYINEFSARRPEYESCKFDHFKNSQFDKSLNEFSQEKLAYQTRNYYSKQPRCAVVQMRKTDRDSNFSEIKKRNATSNVFSQEKHSTFSVPKKAKINYGENYDSFTSLNRRKKRMTSNYNNKKRFLNRGNEIIGSQDNILRQNSDIQQEKRISNTTKPYICVVTTKESSLGKVSSNKGTALAGILAEDVDLEPNRVTKAFIKGEVERDSKINVEGNWFIRNKLLVLFENQGVSTTEKGYPCEISNLNKVNIKLEKGTQIANISYSNEGLQNEVVTHENTEIFTPDETSSQVENTLNAVEDNDTTGRPDFFNKAKVYVGGASICKKWDKRIIEEWDKRNVEENKPVLSNNECMKIGIHEDHFVSQKKVSLKKPEIKKDGISFVNKINHREKVLSEIKIFFQFKIQEGYIIDLQREIEEIKLKYCRDLEDINFQVKNLECEIGNRNNFVNSAPNLSEDFFEKNAPRTLGVSQAYSKQGFSSGDDVQRQNILVNHKYRQNYDDFPGKIKAEGKLEKIDFNRLIQPAHKVSLNGSKIFLPPVKKLNEANTELDKCMTNVVQMRQFIKQVSGDRKQYVENILKAYN